MDVKKILTEIDAEISRLTQVRALLSQAGIEAPRRGRPRGSINSPKPAKVAAKKSPAAKRTMSAEGKARIAAAQKARWAKQKKAAKNS